jgi:hypothetical protein
MLSLNQKQPISEKIWLLETALNALNQNIPDSST